MASNPNTGPGPGSGLSPTSKGERSTSESYANHKSLLDEATALYKSLASVPVITALQIARAPPQISEAGFDGDDESEGRSIVIRLEYSIKDFERPVKRRTNQTFHVLFPSSPNPAPRIIPDFLNEITPEIIWDGTSPSGCKRAIFRVANGGSSEKHSSSEADPSGKKLSIEIWDTNTNQIINFQDVTKAHKFFIVNETFGFPRWNRSETLLAYVAEVNESHSEKDSSLIKNRYKPDFGEQLNDIRNPSVFVSPVVLQEKASAVGTRKSKLVYQVTGHSSAFPSELAYGQPAFGPRSDGQTVQLFCTGFSSLPDGRRMGLVYCQNRLASIYEFNFKIENEALVGDKVLNPSKSSKLELFDSRRLTNPSLSARSPRVLGEEVYFLSNKVGGPHASCVSLRRLTTSDEKSEKVLVDAVDEPTPENPFPGLYVDQLPFEPFLINPKTSSKLMAVSSIWGSVRTLLTIDLSNGSVKRHSGPCKGSCTVWYTDGHQRLVTVYSRTNQTPQIWLGELLEDLTFSWKLVKKLEAPDLAQESLSQICSEVIDLSQTEYSQEVKATEIVLTSPCENRIARLKGAHNSQSLIVIPHGGPHSTLVDEFSPSTAAMAYTGHSIAYLNYPGSLGFGQKWIDYLRKNLGTADVESCKAATDYLLTHSPHEYERLYVNGGSHGGFITAHLTSRYPNMFDAACMRNPVVDLVGTASGGSDIPDWSFAEVNIDFPLNGHEGIPDAPVSVNERDYKILREASPISNIKYVKTPTLLLLGDADRRVSHQQGLAWYHGLKGRKVKTDVMMFNNNSHPLSSIEAESGSFGCFLEFILDCKYDYKANYIKDKKRREGLKEQ